MTRKPLTPAQVKEVVDYYHQGYGARRISWILEIPEGTIIDILQGRSHRKVTGGRIMNGRRPEAVWRGSNKSFQEVMESTESI